MTNSQDFDRLSAYIDNQLSARERAEVEARLSREPELQATLSDLQRTVRVLRLLPVVKPPRRFTLTPAMVGARGTRREPLFPALRLASAFCAIVLAVVLAGDFATQGGLAGSAAVAREAIAPTATLMLEVAPAGGTEPTEGVGEITANYAASEEVLTSTTADAEVTPPNAAMAAPETTATPEGTDSRAGATVSPTDKTVDETATPESTQLAAESVMVADTATPEPAADVYAGQPPTVAPPPSGLGPLRVFEIAVAILAVLLGLGAWFTRRSA